MDWLLTWVADHQGLIFVLIAMPVVFFSSITRFLPNKHKHKEETWQPALRADLDPEHVHVLGGSYPQSNSTFLEHVVKQTYTVPKDPEEYAKIFVPTKDNEGNAE